ncbi:hypothetical protein [Aureibacter tunicatorum]|uniref:Uncharacterized protein n=1 Tax=Aureibacter tunicatorum TaxID=866807 RepID=A0AAE3XP54_9BACT|nr:hypothetical protein [Aureibacter tunicatorum]MDR6240542.1 hypothetical protein [Aureibacter tunicatorum]BDD06597.1 hypothetical protein AUTU_40800 [Aureibacter tunicatorum]
MKDYFNGNFSNDKRRLAGKKGISKIARPVTIQCMMPSCDLRYYYYRDLELSERVSGDKDLEKLVYLLDSYHKIKPLDYKTVYQRFGLLSKMFESLASWFSRIVAVYSDDGNIVFHGGAKVMYRLMAEVQEEHGEMVDYVMSNNLPIWIKESAKLNEPWNRRNLKGLPKEVNELWEKLLSQKSKFEVLVNSKEKVWMPNERHGRQELLGAIDKGTKEVEYTLPDEEETKKKLLRPSITKYNPKLCDDVKTKKSVQWSEEVLDLTDSRFDYSTRVAPPDDILTSNSGIMKGEFAKSMTPQEWHKEKRYHKKLSKPSSCRPHLYGPDIMTGRVASANKSVISGLGEMNWFPNFAFNMYREMARLMNFEEGRFLIRELLGDQLSDTFGKAVVVPVAGTLYDHPNYFVNVPEELTIKETVLEKKIEKGFVDLSLHMPEAPKDIEMYLPSRKLLDTELSALGNDWKRMRMQDGEVHERGRFIPVPSFIHLATLLYIMNLGRLGVYDRASEMSMAIDFTNRLRKQAGLEETRRTHLQTHLITWVETAHDVIGKENYFKIRLF